MGRKASAGAADWALVLSELAEVEVTLEWERPAWRVRWSDGPTVAMLAERAEALSGYRVGQPVDYARMRFERHHSPVAWALAWLDTGPPAGSVSAALGAVETAADGAAYPLRRHGEAVTAARLLTVLAAQDEHRMGRLLAEARGTLPPVPPAGEKTVAGLPGRVVSLSWLRGGPPPELLAPAPVEQAPRPPEQRHESRDETRRCARCGEPVPARGTGRPARYCGGACRAAAFRARQTAPQT